jgi:hypothetical protein
MSDTPRTMLDTERQQRLHRLLHGGGPATPPPLRAALATAATAPAARRRDWSWIATRVAAPVTAAAVLVAVIVVLLAGSAPAPTVAEAARLTALAPTAPAPPRDADRPELLDAQIAGVTYPEWDDEFEWRAVGQRSDTVGGRRTRTVFYHHTHHTIGYTIVSGEPLEPPPDAERFVVDGMPILAYKDGPRDVVVFERGGRTCVLAGEVHRRSTLLELASWKGAGAVRS